MKRILLFSFASLLILSSCGNREVSHARLIEFYNNGTQNTLTGYVKRYSVYKNSIKKGNLWHIYDKSGNFNIWARDTTMEKLQYNFPEFSASMAVSGIGSPARLYSATNGRFRMLGLMEADITGEFYFRLKNGTDSMEITNGYFRVFLEFADTTLTK